MQLSVIVTYLQTIYFGQMNNMKSFLLFRQCKYKVVTPFTKHFQFKITVFSCSEFIMKFFFWYCMWTKQILQLFNRQLHKKWGHAKFKWQKCAYYTAYTRLIMVLGDGTRSGLMYQLHLNIYAYYFWIANWKFLGFLTFHNTKIIITYTMTKHFLETVEWWTLGKKCHQK